MERAERLQSVDSLKSPFKKRPQIVPVTYPMDRRDYYRLADRISVHHKVVADSFVQQSNAADAFDLVPGFHLLRDLFALQLEAGEAIRHITEADRALGSFVHNLDQRLGLLTQIVTGNLTRVDDEQQGDEHLCNISPGGMSFLTEDLLAPETRLALKIVFATTSLALVCFGRVSYCRLEDEVYRTGVQFLRLDTLGEQLISRHIIHRQAQERRQRLQASR
jgi:hypothetical protein